MLFLPDTLIALIRERGREGERVTYSTCTVRVTNYQGKEMHILVKAAPEY